jgi:Polysaccharide deacetylase
MGSDCGIHRLLQILDRAGVLAGIVLSGILAEQYPQNVRAIADAGHEIIARSYAQDIVPAPLNEENDRTNIERTTRLLEQVTGHRPVYPLSLDRTRRRLVVHEHEESCRSSGATRSEMPEKSSFWKAVRGIESFPVRTISGENSY